MKTRYLLAVVMVSLTGFGQGLKLTNGKFSESLSESVRCGVISRIEVSNVPVSMLDLDTLLEAAKFKADEPYQQALTSRAPASGKIFIILTFEVKDGFSIGRYDYVLGVGNQTAPIEALTVRGAPFDPRVWELRAENGMKVVEALFEIPLPSEPMTGYLRPQLNTTISEDGVALPIGREVDTPPAEPVSTGPEADAAPAAAAEEAEPMKKPEEKAVAEKAPEKKAPEKKAPEKKKPGKKPAKKTNGKTTVNELDDLF
ncbi:MAG: hypothetical protein RRC34_06415 [Lentisphaeria bacterium]|nr:hypothetical protein [Lentisphaeria bacterium]